MLTLFSKNNGYLFDGPMKMIEKEVDGKTEYYGVFPVESQNIFAPAYEFSKNV